MNKVLNMTYASSLTDLCAVNSSFDKGVLRIAYTGVNRNSSCITKETFERCIKTMFGCPIVCNYDRDTDTIGGHDMAVVRDSAGSMRLINLTSPVGFIPESAKYWWDYVDEEDGTTHEYLFVEALLWKRQEAYRKIKKDGITAQSMEITVKDGESIDGIFYIYDFEFTAFALIGIAPCFESSALELFSQQGFKEQLSEMMRDLKESFQMVTPSQEDDDTHPQNYSMEGGEKVLQDKIELASKYGIDIESLDFSLDDYTEEELIEKFEAMNEKHEDTGEAACEAVNESVQSQYALTSNLISEIARALESEMVQCEWGEHPLYLYVDCDFDASEVYCWDTRDWLLYGFTYSVDGDVVSIDFESKKRKKYVIADFDEGEQESPFAATFKLMEQMIQSGSEWEAKYHTASDTITTMETELGELRQFKADTENAAAQNARDEVFAQFEDLVGVEAFETLRNDCDALNAAEIEEKCFAIRGRQGAHAIFTLEDKAPRLKVEKFDITKEPYGGLFTEYGVDSKD